MGCDELAEEKAAAQALINNVISTKEHEQLVDTITILAGLDAQDFEFVGLSYDKQNDLVVLSGDIEGYSVSVSTDG